MSDLTRRPNRPRREPRNPSNGPKPSHGLKSVYGLGPSGWILRHSVTKALRRQIIATVSAVVVARFAHELVNTFVPFQFLCESEAFLAPIFEASLVERRLCLEREWEIFNDPQTPISRQINFAALHRDRIHLLVRQPAFSREVMKGISNMADRPARRSNPDIVREPLCQTISIFKWEAVDAAKRRQRHSAQNPQPAIGRNIQTRTVVKDIPRVLRRQGSPIPCLVRREIIQIAPAKLSSLKHRHASRPEDVNRLV